MSDQSSSRPEESVAPDEKSVVIVEPQSQQAEGAAQVAQGSGQEMLSAGVVGRENLRRLMPRTRDQQVTGVLCLVLFFWSVMHQISLSSWGSQEIEISRLPDYEYSYTLDPNEASWIELAMLNGIGETLGKRIVADREAHGPFLVVDDLQRVNGIGLKTLEKFRSQLKIDSDSEK